MVMSSVSNNSIPSDRVNSLIDESLYSRQLYVLGHEAMHRMSNSNILIWGLKGLGVEVAKDVVLAGVKTVTIYDPESVEIGDLCAQFFLKEEDVGKRRDECSLARLAELNEYVPLSILESNPIESLSCLDSFQVVAMLDQPLSLQLTVDAYCHSRNIAFISGNLHGLFASAFCDFGQEFIVSDTTGEPPIQGMINSITSESNSVVTCLEESRHNLEDGDTVTFREVKGMAVNEKEFKVTTLGPFTFSIGDTSSLGQYISGGIFEQVKKPKRLTFLPLSESLLQPEYVISDFAKMERMEQLHHGFQAMNKFREKFNRLPKAHNVADAEEFLSIASTFTTEIDKELLKQLSFQATGYLAPMAAFLGGMLAQEVIKACSGKFHPIHQHFYFDSLECLTINNTLNGEEQFKAIGSRYDPQIAVFGRSFQEKLAKKSGFLVGAGAIGCELLKLFALIGLSTSPSSSLTVTDMDNIEKSNLNRQFLFRPWDMGQPKSRTAANAAQVINPSIRINALVDRVGPETENIFNDNFFESITFVANALDNVDARRYMDRRCVYYRLPLLESGTLGTKGNTQSVIPHLTESYSSSSDPPEKTIPMCTLHNFPNTIEHAIEWAVDQFQGTFKNEAENAKVYLEQGDAFLKSLSNNAQQMPQQVQYDRIEGIMNSLTRFRPQNYFDCVAWARLRFEELFANNIKQLLFNFPLDSVTSTGTPFWSGPKRAPTPLLFDVNDPLHLNFIRNAARLRADVYGIPCDKSLNLEMALNQVNVPEFVPKSGVKFQVSEEDNSKSSNLSSPTVSINLSQLPNPSSLIGISLNPLEFEKDDATNGHIAFITACSNLRATNYSIATADEHKVKQIAGRIIPAIATVTALVAGLVGLELYKLVSEDAEQQQNTSQSKSQRLARYKNGFINLALPFFAFSEPIAAPIQKYSDIEWTLWDRFSLPRSNLKQLFAYFEEEYKLSISMVSYGAVMLYASFGIKKDKLEERLSTPIPELIEKLSGKQISAHVNYVVLEVLAETIDGGEDVEVPYIRMAVNE